MSSLARTVPWGIAVACFVVFALRFLETAQDATALGFPVGVDYRLHVDAAARWLSGGGFYLPSELAGPFSVDYPVVLYPPTMLLLFVPFIWLPAVLWWAVPTAVMVAVVVRHRPSPWAIAAIGLCLLTPWPTIRLITGNPAMWFTAALALATIRPYTAPLVLLKPTIAPLALFGVWRREWWAGFAVLIAVSLPFAGLWIDYVHVALNARDHLGLLYSLTDAPLLLIPIIAWAAKGKKARPPEGERAESED